MTNFNILSMNTVKNGARKFVSGMSKGDVLAPVILLEACVTGGRTYQAYKRDGFIEARERFTEESLGALFWFCGVKVFNRIGDSVGEYLLKKKYAKTTIDLKNVKFDTRKDAIRNPMGNYIHNLITTSKKPGNSLKTVEAEALRKTLTRFKFAKITASVLLANAIVGFVVPKMNQKITKMYQAGLKKLDYTHPELLKTGNDMDGFLQGPNDQKTKKDVNFTGFTMLDLANTLEKNPTAQLLSVDTGIAGGRAVSARNKYERIEVLFRDIASIYFYLFCRKHLNAFLNKMEDDRPTRLDPVSAQELHENIINNKKFKSGMSHSEFETLMFGDQDKKAIEKIIEKLKFNDHGIITVKGFCEQTKADNQSVRKALRMSQLQPKVAVENPITKQIEMRRILTLSQVEGLYSNGLIHNSEFMKKMLRKFFGEDFSDPMKFVKYKDIIEHKETLIEYIKDIITKTEKADGVVTENFLNAVKRNNFLKNTFNLGVGFAVSGYFLSTAIPKIQYWITKMKTGENKFPGVCEYKK